ncbi:TIM44-like domain-containing protein [Modicisalibacter sp. 'Wilcox']|uniref:Tim44 domain-containing protein n=1 Tax=Modicisalibacter sp. 'Wilcox' TaxID=2679914 RepID=UPI0013D34C00|nr:TIM44-like domain-containing protein [Modicisalibacter sp. 'Wilcox']
MRNLFVMLLVGLLGFGLAVDHAEARRLGGGKSIGSYSRSTSSHSTTTQRSTGTTHSKPSKGLSRFAGPLAGMLAGGLLASLFFGGAFDGFRFMDILLIALIAWLAFRFLRARRAATASGPHHQARNTHTFGNDDTAPGSFGAAGGIGGGAASTPSWFNKERFLNEAKQHFMELQRAWDNNDLPKIQDYVTPSLYNLLREQRANEPANNRTEIVRLFVELGDVREHGTQAEASVIFHGIMDENGEHNEFNETWHLIRELRDGAPWHIQGIEQNPS